MKELTKERIKNRFNKIKNFVKEHPIATIGTVCGVGLAQAIIIELAELKGTVDLEHTILNGMGYSDEDIKNGDVMFSYVTLQKAKDRFELDDPKQRDVLMAIFDNKIDDDSRVGTLLAIINEKE